MPPIGMLLRKMSNRESRTLNAVALSKPPAFFERLLLIPVKFHKKQDVPPLALGTLVFPNKAVESGESFHPPQDTGNSSIHVDFTDLHRLPRASSEGMASGD